MLILGLNGSPRKNGNTSILLSEFMEEAEKLGAVTRTIIADKKNILPCKEYKTCESKGFCPIDDDMENEIYSLLWDADLIVIATHGRTGIMHTLLGSVAEKVIRFSKVPVLVSKPQVKGK